MTVKEYVLYFYRSRQAEDYCGYQNQFDSFNSSGYFFHFTSSHGYGDVVESLSSYAFYSLGF